MRCFRIISVIICLGIGAISSAAKPTKGSFCFKYDGSVATGVDLRNGRSDTINIEGYGGRFRRDGQTLKVTKGGRFDQVTQLRPIDPSNTTKGYVVFPGSEGMTALPIEKFQDVPHLRSGVIARHQQFSRSLEVHLKDGTLTVNGLPAEWILGDKGIGNLTFLAVGGRAFRIAPSGTLTKGLEVKFLRPTSMIRNGAELALEEMVFSKDLNGNEYALNPNALDYLWQRQPGRDAFIGLDEDNRIPDFNSQERSVVFYR